MALPWTILLALSGIYVQGAQAWCSEEDTLELDKLVSEPDIVKFALSAFHKKSKDEYAYRVIHIMNFLKVQEEPPQTFFVKLRLTRTICMKFEKSLDTCPLPELQNVRQNMSIHPFTVILICSFSISSPGSKQFNLLKMTCSEGLL
ncbi:cystatin E2 isoform X1 [Mus musculus]|uniref:cystatin E2 isoform X1 n=1 Tax=Mus musculus TaxID=10090 RepID=UPI0005ABA470|nr:cystatin E2 isoform X1 [Mus musculus]|eukprot:XP_011238145.1 PREDICTED: cystatin E2 isoform X1 [Mus musculus]